MTVEVERPERAARLQRALGEVFEVVRLVGRGGFAEVYEVRDTGLRRRLAAKVLREDIPGAADLAPRFKQEARALAQLSHAHTVPVHFVGEAEGLVFYMMPFIDGITLADVLRADGPLDLSLAVGVAAPILDALDHAHRHGIIHRDIKPDNILIDGASGRPLLVDFGISQLQEDELATDGGVVGTPHYMSPEQALGEQVDGRSDVYAMGAVIFQMLTGAPPFSGNTPGDIVARHLAEPVKFPDAAAANLPGWMRDLLERALEKRKENRFGSAGQMLAALRAGLPSVAVPMVSASHALGPIDRTEPTLRMDPVDTRSAVRGRRRRRAALVIAGAFALASGGAAALSFGARPRPTLVVENGLFAPVVLALNGGARQRLAPGDSLRLPLARGEQATARWQLVVPDGDDGEPVGEALGSSFVVNNPNGEMRHRLDPASIGRNYLIPTITNSTADTLRAEMTDSAGARLACDCTVPPGAGRHVLGWVRRDQLSTILVRNASSRAIIYESLIARADNATGALDLSLRAADFVPPTTLAVRATDSSKPNVIRAPPPEIRRAVPLPAIADSVDTTTAAPATEKPRDRNVLAPIFRNR